MPRHLLDQATGNARARWKRRAEGSNWVGVSRGYKRYERLQQQTDVPCVTFYVKRKLPPKEVGSEGLLTIPGVITDVIETGGWVALASLAPHGVATPALQAGGKVQAAMNIPVGFGTAGALAKDRSNQRWMLSANHVMALNHAHVGRQPDIHLNSTAGPLISNFVVEVPLVRNDNLVDVAAARMSDQTIRGASYYPPTLGLSSSIPVNPQAFKVLDRPIVRKMGASSGVRDGFVTGNDPSIEVVVDGLQFNPEFDDLLIIDTSDGSSFAEDGDSGALVIQKSTGAPVGLLVAKTNTGNLAAAAYLSTAFKELQGKARLDLTFAGIDDV